MKIRIAAVIAWLALLAVAACAARPYDLSVARWGAVVLSISCATDCFRYARRGSL